MENKEEIDKKIWQRVQTRIAISNFQKEELTMPKNKLLKMVATFIVTIGITAGVVFAGGVVYEKVFQKPEKIENYIEELKVTKEDLDKIISQEEAIQKAKENMKRFGIEIKEEEISKTEIMKAPNYEEITYHIVTSQGVSVNINAITGEVVHFDIEDGYSTEELEKFTTTKENIQEEAKKKMKEYGFGDEYKISYISCNNQDQEEKAYFWYISFAKEYDGLFNETESVSMTIIPQINFVTSLGIKNEPFDNHPIVISEEEAVEIAKQKDTIINQEGYQVKDIGTELAIKQMNPEVYLKENGLEKGNEVINLEDGSTYSYYTYRMNGKARKVYVVEITYENRPFGQTRKYYVDVTTGEVIGGEDIFDLEETK